MAENPLLIVLGPTASGKTKLAVTLADALGGEIISADSRQVFRGMDIGTGKDLDEYQVNGKQIPYHLIDHMKAGTRYQVDSFKEDFYRVFDEVTRRQKLPILCGGTGMYIHSILQNYQFTSIPVNAALRESLQEFNLVQLQACLQTYPEASRAHADQSTRKRLIRAIEIATYLKYNVLEEKVRSSFSPLVIGLTSTVEERRSRILERLDLRLRQGLIEEVERLLKGGVSKEMLVFYGLEYKFVVSYLDGELSREGLRDKLYVAICQYAKRQMTFFRKMEKDGIDIKWFNLSDDDIKENVIDLLGM